jgi:hypothetical protein
MAVPINAGIVSGMSGRISWYLPVTKRTVIDTINTIRRSVFTLFKM